MPNILEFATKGKLAPSTVLFQGLDGTVFYFDWQPQRLYVKWHGSKIIAKLPGLISYVCSFGNAVYMVAGDKIYKAVLAPPDSIVVSPLRDLSEDIEFNYGGILTNQRGDKTIVSRMCDDPETDGILAENVGQEFEELAMREVHRGKVICISQKDTVDRPVVREVGDKVIIIDVPNRELIKSCTARGSSPFIYFSYDKELFTLDTEKTEFLPSMKIDGFDKLHYIVGVNKAVMSVVAELGGNKYMMTALLPNEHAYIDRERILEAEKSQQSRVIEDLRGNVEKLQSDIKNIKLTDNSASRPECVICLDNLPNIVFFDCMHVAVCEECWEGNQKNRLTTCPNCRQPIKKGGKVFL